MPNDLERNDLLQFVIPIRRNAYGSPLCPRADEVEVILAKTVHPDPGVTRMAESVFRSEDGAAFIEGGLGTEHPDYLEHKKRVLFTERAVADTLAEIVENNMLTEFELLTGALLAVRRRSSRLCKDDRELLFEEACQLANELGRSR